MSPQTSGTVVLTQMPRQLFVRHPAKRRTAGPRPRVGAGILDGDLVLHRVEISARKPLDQFQLVGVGKASVGEPEVLVESPRVDDQRLTLPFSHSAAVIQRVVIVTAHLTGMGAPVQVDDAVVAVSAANQDENPLAVT